MSPPRPPADTENVDEPRELRLHVAHVLDQRTTIIGNDAFAVFPFSGDTVGTDEDLSRTLGELLLQLLIEAARSGEIDRRSRAIADLRAFVREAHLGIGQLFRLCYLLERAALDELALDESFGVTSEPWPAVAQIVRRASFDVLAAYAERLALESGEGALVDPLTTLHTRGLLEIALEKEIQRSERFGHPFALIMLDVDHLAQFNERHGYGFGDRVIERIGINLRHFFREQDWVSRCTGDRFAVLLPETAPEAAERLAERVRVTVQDRFALPDHKTGAHVDVTVSVGVVIVETIDKSARAEPIMHAAEEAVSRAKQAGRNRVERMLWAAGPR